MPIKRDARLETRAARGKLKIQHEPHWRQLVTGVSLGYRKGQRGGTWIARKLADGKYRKKTLGPADDVSEADGESVLDYAQAHEKALAFAKAPAEERATSNYTVDDALDDYLRWHRTHGKSAERTAKVVDKHLRPKFGKKRVADLTAKQIRAWHSGLIEPDEQGRRRSKATANRILTVFKAALNHAYHDGIVPHADAWGRVRPFRNAESARDRYLSQDECTRLINACDPAFRELVTAALYSGCRYGELIRAEARDYNPDAGTLTVPIAKSNKARHVPLTDAGQAVFERAIMGKQGGDRIFTREDGEPWGEAQQIRRMKTASEAASLEPRANFHDLRRTYGALLAMQGVPMHVIAAAMGHADTRMTERHYAHLQPNYVADTIRAHLPNFGNQGDKVVPLGGRSGT